MLPTKQELDKSISDVNTSIAENYKEFSDGINNLSTLISKIQHLISSVQGNVDDILSRIEKMQSTPTSSAQYRGVLDLDDDGSSSSSYSSSGIVVADEYAPSSGTCDALVLSNSKNYYKKQVTIDISSCVDASATQWFDIDADAIGFTETLTYGVIRFQLDMEISGNGKIPSPRKFPWEWIGGADPLASYGTITEDKLTNIVVEVIGYWKCGEWNFRGRLIDAYHIKCTE